ncbi:MAG: translocation/assembly module TamB domain-containing protein [Polyangiales bacterium]
MGPEVRARRESENAEAPPRFGCGAESVALPTTRRGGGRRRALAALGEDADGRGAAGAAGDAAAPKPRSRSAGASRWGRSPARWPLRQGRVPGLPASLRGVLEPDLDPAARAAVTVDLGGTLASPTLRARAEASAPLLTQAGISAPLHATARVDLETSGATLATPLRLTASLEGGLADGAPDAQRGTLAALARLSAPISQLLDDARGATIEALRLSARNVRLEQFADLAARGVQGGLDVDLARTDTPSRPFAARVALREVRTVPPGLERIVAAIPPVNATLIGYIDEGAGGAESAHVCVVAGAGSGVTDCQPQPVSAEDAVSPGLLRADAELPFPRGLAHGPDLAHLAVSLRALDFRVDGLGALAPASTVTDLGGVMSATLRWRAADPIRPVGRFALSHGRATLASLGEPVDDLNVELSVEGRRAHIERFEGRLGVGTIRVTGDALVGHGDELARVALEATTDELPAVSNGHTWAWVTGAIGTELVMRRSGVQVNVRVHEARVRVQDEPARALINMSPDPAVFVRGRTRLSRTVAADTIPIDLAFTLETPMWLRRSDFVVAINGHGSVHMDRAGAAVAAAFESARVPSWVSFYGKRFDLERANITLDGSVNINPQLDLVARHDGGAIGDVVLSLEGRLYDPRISLTAASQPDAGMAEVLSMLILGRRDNAPTSGQTDLATQAGDMARSLVTGLTLGFITSTLRAQFAFLPTLIAEPGTSDAGRYGAGFNLGPRVYLQATYGTASTAVGLGTSGGSGAQEFRVLLEYAMTSSLSSSLTYGTWPQFGTWQNNWGFDVFWSP